MKVLLLTQYYSPEPHEKWRELANGLRENGHSVEILTGFPCYPAGKTYPGYRQSLHFEETIDENRVIRVPQFPDHSSSLLKRFLYYFSFALSAVCFGWWRIKRPDVILVYQSALPIGFSAWILSRMMRVPYVLDLADLWPESVASSGFLSNPLLLRCIRWGASFVYHGAAQINVISKGYRQSLLDMRVPKEKLNLIYCWSKRGLFDPCAIDEEFSQREGLSHRFNIVYAGTIGPCQDLSVLFPTADYLKDLPDLQFILAGSGIRKEPLEDQTQEAEMHNIRFLGRRPPEEIRKLFASADMLLVHLKPDPMSELSIPSKTFDYMASGRPLLMAVKGEASRIVEEHKCGVVAPPSSPKELADAIRTHYNRKPSEREQLGMNARTTYSKHFSYDQQLPLVIKSLQAAVNSKSCTSLSQKVFLLANNIYRSIGKRVFDLVVSLTACLVLTPVIVLVAIALRLSLGSPILFQQSRAGHKGMTFVIYKFRTMTEEKDSSGQLLSDEERLTTLGSWLRRTSLDELPQLWNVVKGDMSLVGPRPLLTQYLDLYSKRQARRHEVKPGITGLAQINGRNAISWDDRFEHDVEYVEKHSLLFDIRILAKTLLKVVTSDGATTEHNTTSPYFTGAAAHSGKHKTDIAA